MATRKGFSSDNSLPLTVLSEPQLRLPFFRRWQRGLHFTNYGKLERACGVNFNPVSLIIRHVDSFVDRVNRARRNASAAVDAHLDIDVGALLVGVKARYRTHRYAIGEAAQVAVIRYDMRHGAWGSVLTVMYVAHGGFVAGLHPILGYAAQVQ